MTALFGDRAEILISKPFFLEVLARDVDKGDALARLCSILGIDIERSIACGDAMNDVGMLRAAGLGCAPSNAIAAAKEAAAFVSTRSNEDGFVADVVERFILN